MKSINDIFNKRYNGKSVFFSSYKNSLKKVIEKITELNSWEKTYFIYSNAFDSLTNESVEELKGDLLQTTFLSVDLLFEKEIRQMFSKHKNDGIIFYFETYSYRTKYIFRFEFLKTLKKHPSLQEGKDATLPNPFKEDGGGTNHLTEENGAGTPSLQGIQAGGGSIEYLK
mgnify:CR=1 FL=1